MFMQKYTARMDFLLGAQIEWSAGCVGRAKDTN